MELTGFVRRHAETFGTASGKLAADLAALLDGELMSTQAIHAQGRKDNQLALLRLEVFEDFCAVCAQCQVPVPELDRVTLEHCLPQAGSKEDAKKVMDLVDDAHRLVNFSGPVGDCKSRLLSLTCCLKLMPGLAVGYGDGFSIFRAALNLQLLVLGKPTMRPDYSAMQVMGAVNQQAAPRELNVVIVDDSVCDIVRTLRALAGWPGLRFGILHFAPVCDRWNCSLEKKVEIVRATTATILKARPDIVIMDEGLPVSDGGELIRAIKAAEPDFQIEFVGSTGGSGNQLRDAGALLNLEKGRAPKVLGQAIRRFSDRV